MKTPQDRFEESYAGIPVPADNKKGYKIKYIYYGPWYYWDIPEKELKRVKRFVALMCVIGSTTFAIGSLIRSGVNLYRIVGISTLFSICALIYEVIGVIQFYTAAYRTTVDRFESVERKLKLAPLLRVAFLAISIVACIYYMSVYNCSIKNMVTTMLYLVSAICSCIIAGKMKTMIVRTEKNIEAGEKIRKSRFALGLDEKGHPFSKDNLKENEEKDGNNS